ncbi:MAG TPA: carboxypeptidase-like regulatory domain-containing protein, partial [Pseudoxanthomonas sp.]
MASMASVAMAQSATGAVAGRTDAGTRVTITNPSTGFTRSVTAGTDGGYRLSLLPPGNYTVQAEGGQPVQIVVALGGTTSVNLGSAGATNLEAVQVIGSRI